MRISLPLRFVNLPFLHCAPNSVRIDLTVLDVRFCFVLVFWGASLNSTGHKLSTTSLFNVTPSGKQEVNPRVAGKLVNGVQTMINKVILSILVSFLFSFRCRLHSNPSTDNKDFEILSDQCVDHALLSSLYFVSR